METHTCSLDGRPLEQFLGRQLPGAHVLLLAMNWNAAPLYDTRSRISNRILTSANTTLTRHEDGTLTATLTFNDHTHEVTACALPTTGLGEWAAEERSIGIHEFATLDAHTLTFLGTVSQRSTRTETLRELVDAWKLLTPGDQGAALTLVHGGAPGPLVPLLAAVTAARQ